jgi:hypothetical protein
MVQLLWKTGWTFPPKRKNTPLEVEMGGLWFEASPGKQVSKNLSQTSKVELGIHGSHL